MMKSFAWLFLLVLLTSKANVLPAQPVGDQVMVEYKDLVSPFKINTFYGLAGDSVEVELLFNESDNYQLMNSSDAVVVDDDQWVFILPEEPGVYTSYLVNKKAADTIRINYITMVPASRMKDQKLGAYKIGEYPESQKEAYQPPRGFIRVTKENEDLYLSPRIKLKQFICKQSLEYPKMVVLQELLILKLELIIDYLRQQNMNVERLSVLSGYRTPFYNKAIGNVRYSRHQYGDASDIFVDNNKDFIIDDLNNDGRHDVLDARMMYNAINDMMSEKLYAPFIGGMGIYQANSRHTAFVHIDVRGYQARWGL